MIENIIYTDAKTAVINFFKKSFDEFDSKLQARFLNFFTEILNYEEEGKRIRPNIILTNNIDTIVKNVPSAFKLHLFSDYDDSMFNSRMKSLINFCQIDWCVYVNIKENEIAYGIVKAMNSIKEKEFTSIMFDSEVLKEKTDKLFAINIRPINSYSVRLRSLNGDILNVSYSLDGKKVIDVDEEIVSFVDASFSKLRTTQTKLKEIKTMYTNIFNNVRKSINGAICVVVDKDYVDNDFLDDGIWLKDPIAFSKIFVQSKSYSEAKLKDFSNLFMSMLNYDGITVIDNTGKIRAYNVFVEPDLKKVGKIIGGARKRAAYTIINSRRKRIIGVYFQSHEGEVFYLPVKK